MHSRTPENGATRQERKQRTRQALLDAALELLEEQSFSSLSLRQVTRAAGIVPTAFYRHFEDMEELGLVLIDESFRTLRAMIRAARADPRTYEHMIHNSVQILVGYVHEHDTHFRFIARERFGGVASLRHAIRTKYACLPATSLRTWRAFPISSAGAQRIYSCSPGSWSTPWSPPPRRFSMLRRRTRRRGGDRRHRPAPAAHDHPRRSAVAQHRSTAEWESAAELAAWEARARRTQRRTAPARAAPPAREAPRR